jgi:hypothetical protein
MFKHKVTIFLSTLAYGLSILACGPNILDCGLSILACGMNSEAYIWHLSLTYGLIVYFHYSISNKGKVPSIDTQQILVVLYVSLTIVHVLIQIWQGFK